MRLPEDHPFGSGTQAEQLYRRLRHYPTITLREIHDRGCDTARIRTDIRPWLRKNGLDYKIERIPGYPHDRLYSIVRRETA